MANDINPADAWDLGYDTAVDLLELGMLRLATQGESALKGMKRPVNPYRKPTLV